MRAKSERTTDKYHQRAILRERERKRTVDNGNDACQVRFERRGHSRRGGPRLFGHKHTMRIG